MHRIKPLSLLIVGLLAFSAYGENWPAWRGPQQNGISKESAIAAEWSPTKNILWKLDLPGTAPSTPVIWNQQIFMTAGDGADLLLLSVSTNGKVLWQKTVGSGNRDIRSGESNQAASSPVTDGQHVWAFFGTGLLVCLDSDGQEKWRVDLAKNYGEIATYWGMSTTPVLYENMLLMFLMHDNAQIVFALDKESGKELWLHKRSTDARHENLHSYASPVVYWESGQPLLLAHGADYITAHSINSGEEVWRCGGLQKSGSYNNYLRLVATPTVGDNIIIVPSAKNGPILGLNPSGASGNITGKPDNYHWKWENNTSDVPSPLLHDGIVYMMRENGVLITIDAGTGEQIYKESVYRKRHRASPVYADGKLYFTAYDGTTNVIRAGRKYELLSTNILDQQSSASPAISEGRLYLRTAKSLYAIGE